MNIFGREFTLNNLFTPKKEGNSWWYRFFSTKSDVWKSVDCIDAYESVPEVAAIISTKAKAWSNMRLKEVDKDGNEKQTTEGQALIKLIYNPNWFQQGKEFLIQTKTCRELFGDEYLYKLTPVGFKPDIMRVKALFTLPKNIVKCEYDSKIPFFLHVVSPPIKYQIKVDTDWKPFESANIIHFNDNRVSLKSATDKNLLNGESKLQPNRVVVNNMKAAYESRGVILKKRGANGAWVTKSKDGLGAVLPMQQDEKDELQGKMTNYGTMADQDQDIITNADLAWVQRGTNNPKNLGLFEEIQAGFNKLLDTFGVPKELFVTDAGSTYENQKTAEKGLYIRTIMPEANEWIGGLSSEFLTGDTTVVAEYFHLPIFQEDLKQRGDSLTSMVNALSKALADQAITIDQYKEELLKFGIK